MTTPLTEGAVAAGVLETTSPTGSHRRRAWRSPLAIVSWGFLLLVAIAVLLAPLLSPYDPFEQHLDQVLQLPGGQYWLGTDTLGRDVLSRLLWGGRPALAGALEATAVFGVVGVVFGLVAGYSKGVGDRIISGVVDVMGSLPSIVVVFAVLAMFGNSLSAAMISAGLFASYGLIRIVRASTQETREELYVAAARVSGLRGAHHGTARAAEARQPDHRAVVDLLRRRARAAIRTRFPEPRRVGSGAFVGRHGRRGRLGDPAVAVAARAAGRRDRAHRHGHRARR